MVSLIISLLINGVTLLIIWLFIFSDHIKFPLLIFPFSGITLIILGSMEIINPDLLMFDTSTAGILCLIIFGALILWFSIVFAICTVIDMWINELESWFRIIRASLFVGSLTMIILGSIDLNSNSALIYSISRTWNICLVVLGSIIILFLLISFFWLPTINNSRYSRINRKIFNYGFIYTYEKFEKIIVTNNEDNENDEFLEEENNWNMNKTNHYKNENQKVTKKLNLSKEKMLKFDDFFKNKLIGQEEVIKQIKQKLIHFLYQLNDKKTRPIGVFFFVGPTGVGKTEMCKILSEFLYNNNEINRFDMSEYKSEMAINQLIGAPNGYVGYEEGGILINRMKENPNSIILFDEIEKADKNVFDLFLQILDEGIITSSKGERVSFKNNIIVFTSNIGSNLIESHMSKKDVEMIVKNAVNDFFSYELNRPEIIGRIGKENIVSFNIISNFDDLSKILDIHFDVFIKQLENKKIGLKFSKAHVYSQILKDVDITKGARDIRNEFEEFEKHFMHSLFENNYDYSDLRNKVINFDYDNEKVTIIGIKNK